MPTTAFRSVPEICISEHIVYRAQGELQLVLVPRTWREIISIQSKGLGVLYRRSHWSSTSRRSATYSMYCPMSSAFMPTSDTGSALQQNSCSSSTASLTMLCTVPCTAACMRHRPPWLQMRISRKLPNACSCHCPSAPPLPPCPSVTQACPEATRHGVQGQTGASRRRTQACSRGQGPAGE